MSASLRIALIASARHPICEPFAGGLESHISQLAAGLMRRGHEVSLWAAPGSCVTPGVSVKNLYKARLSDRARSDTSMSPETEVHDHYAYLRLMLELSRGPRRYDLIHNHSLHYLPVAMADLCQSPVLTTLHTPPTPWLECAIQAGRVRNGAFVAVSEHTAEAWRHIVPDAAVVPNGISLDEFPSGPGGGAPIWFGRITPEKGTHLALRAAHLANSRLDIAGPISDQTYFETAVRPLLDEHRRHLGHLNHASLANVVGRASCALVTPVWEEPYGLVVAEALACGTPVVGFARGAIPELLDDTCGRLVEPDDVYGLAVAISTAATLSRTAARERAVSHASVDQMLTRYEDVYQAVGAGQDP